MIRLTLLLFLLAVTSALNDEDSRRHFVNNDQFGVPRFIAERPCTGLDDCLTQNLRPFTFVDDSFNPNPDSSNYNEKIPPVNGDVDSGSNNRDLNHRQLPETSVDSEDASMNTGSSMPDESYESDKTPHVWGQPKYRSIRSAFMANSPYVDPSWELPFEYRSLRNQFKDFRFEEKPIKKENRDESKPASEHFTGFRSLPFDDESDGFHGRLFRKLFRDYAVQDTPFHKQDSSYRDRDSPFNRKFNHQAVEDIPFYKHVSNYRDTDNPFDRKFSHYTDTSLNSPTRKRHPVLSFVHQKTTGRWILPTKRPHFPCARRRTTTTTTPSYYTSTPGSSGVICIRYSWWKTVCTKTGPRVHVTNKPWVKSTAARSTTPYLLSSKPSTNSQSTTVPTIQFTTTSDEVMSTQSTLAPVEELSTQPTEEPSTQPTEEPFTQSTEEPFTQPTEEPSTPPTEELSTQPTAEPSTGITIRIRPVIV